jgi:hypothetical protein
MYPRVLQSKQRPNTNLLEAVVGNVVGRSGSDFPFGFDPDPDPDPTLSFKHLGRSDFFTFIHSNANLQSLPFSNVKPTFFQDRLLSFSY